MHRAGGETQEPAKAWVLFFERMLQRSEELRRRRAALRRCTCTESLDPDQEDEGDDKQDADE